jgi:purine-nucleoside phosphorylase
MRAARARVDELTHLRSRELVRKMLNDQVQRAAERVRERGLNEAQVALVLGSGLSGLVDALEDVVCIPYADIPGMASASVAGHPGKLVGGRLEGLRVVAMQGRLHAYEGHALSQVVLGVRLMARLGAATLIVTNAAGGLETSQRPGSLMIITDHLNLTGQNCLVGRNDEALGPRFPDMSAAYDPALRALAYESALEANLVLSEGVYAGVLGPSYETPAEVRMLRVLGASAVGMSTVQEVIAARHLGLRVLGISCVTNLAAGLSKHPLSHAEVEQTARASATALAQLVRGVLRRLPPS